MVKKSESKGQFPAALLRQLGKQTDAELAVEFQLPAPQIRAERRRRGIARKHAVAWTAAQSALLGKMPDKEAARRIGVTTNAVFSKRTALGIPSFGKSLKAAKFHWKAAHLKKLGKVSDAVLAAELGISNSVVTSRRHSLGIGASQPVKATRKPWTKQEVALLGKQPDTIVAVTTGRGRRHVRSKRESLGIPPFQTQRSIEWTAATRKLLGVVSDSELAGQMGVSVGTVALYRRQQSLAASKKSRKTK